VVSVRKSGPFGHVEGGIRSGHEKTIISWSGERRRAERVAEGCRGLQREGAEASECRGGPTGYGVGPTRFLVHAH